MAPSLKTGSYFYFYSHSKEQMKPFDEILEYIAPGEEKGRSFEKEFQAKTRDAPKLVRTILRMHTIMRIIESYTIQSLGELGITSEKDRTRILYFLLKELQDGVNTTIDKQFANSTIE